MGEELAEHEGVVGLGVLLGEADVLVHVEGDDMLEGELALLDEADEVLVGGDRGGASGEAEDEGFVRGGSKVVDPGWRLLDGVQRRLGPPHLFAM